MKRVPRVEAEPKAQVLALAGHVRARGGDLNPRSCVGKSSLAVLPGAGGAQDQVGQRETAEAEGVGSQLSLPAP